MVRFVVYFKQDFRMLMRHLLKFAPRLRSTVLDYPSLGQVNALAQKYRASIIWAVTEDQVSGKNI